jgi:hypothetical protein
VTAKLEGPQPDENGPPHARSQERLPEGRPRWRALSAWSLPRALTALLFLVVALAVPSIRYRASECWASALWGMVLLGSFVGWGGALNARLRPSGRRGWGLDGAVGAAFFLWVGGALAVVHGVSKAAIWIFVLTGIVALAVGAAGAFGGPRAGLPGAPAVRPGARPTLTYAIVVVGVAMLVLLRYVESVWNTEFNVWDDNMAYRQFAQKLIEIGSLYEPFSSRRIASFGGQTMLHAAMLAGAPGIRLHVVDSGLCALLVVGLLLGYGASPARRGAGLLAAILFLALPDPRHNIGSEVSGAMFFLALFRVLDDLRHEPERPWGNAIVLGLLSAGACTLRQSNLPAAAATVGLYFVLRMIHEPPAVRRDLLRETGRTAVAALVALLPWMLTSFANSRTFLYPLMTGNSNPAWGLLGHVNGWEEDRWFLINLFYFLPVRTITFFVIAGCLLHAGRRTSAIRAQLIGTLIGFGLLVHSLQTSIYFDSVGRYYFSFVSAYALALTLFVASRRRFARVGRLLPLVLVLSSIVLHVYESRDDLQKTYTAWVDGADHWRNMRNPDRQRSDDDVTSFYRRLQQVVPPGKAILAMVDHPYLFNFRRNEIFNFDQPGAVSPAPQVPVARGPEAMASYLSGMGIQYLAFIIGDSPEYNYDVWKGRASDEIKPGARGGMYKAQAYYYLDAFDNFTALAASRKVLLHEGDYWVLDLWAPSSADDSAGKPVSNSSDKPVSKPVSKSSGKPVSKSSGKSAGKRASKAATE